MTLATIVYWLAIFISSTVQDASSTNSNPEINMNVTEFIGYYGYPLENHEVTTDDGYILSVQRIPHGIRNVPDDNIGVVLLQHGLVDSSFTWVNNGPNKSLAFVLADAGYDVWLCNSRGNLYSRKHNTLSPESNQFWDFTWEEMAKYDLPASVNYILAATGVEKIGYIGHSQGTEIAFAKLGENGELNSKIFAFVALAPVAYLGNVLDPSRSFLQYSDELNSASQMLFRGEVSSNQTELAITIYYVCSKATNKTDCFRIFSEKSKSDSRNLDKSRIPIYDSHGNAGTSSKNFVHYGQALRSKKFQKFDYGIKGNYRHYHQSQPPKFNLAIENVPVAIFYGGNDANSTPEDVKLVIKELGRAAVLNRFLPNYSHMDFLWAVSANELVFKDIIEFLRPKK